MTNLQAALEYAARGWPVLPLQTVRPDKKCTCGHDDCDKPGKHPRIKGGLLNASTDPDRIKYWWGMWPAANIGVVTGAVSGIIVMDIDDEALAKESIGDKEIPETLIQETGSGGGKHLIFRVSWEAGKNVHEANPRRGFPGGRRVYRRSPVKSQVGP